MTCDWQEQIVLYLDDELGPDAQQDVAGHLLVCPECSTAMIQQTELTKTIRAAARRYSAPPELHVAVLQELRRSERPARFKLWRWSFVFAFPVLLATIAVLIYPHSKPEPVIAMLVNHHITALASEHPVDVISDNHNVQAWFQNKLPFAFKLPELTGSPYMLLGGKLVYVGQSPGAELLCEVRNHKISIFIFQTHDPDSRAVSNRELSFTVNGWAQRGLQYYMVTDASQEEAGKLVAMFQEANRS